MKTLLLLALALGVASPVPHGVWCRHDFAVPQVSVEGTWIREAPPGATALAAYMRIANTGKQALTLSGVTSPLFGEVQLHELLSEDGRVRMHEVKIWPLAVGGSITFKPGDSHVMLMQPKRTLVAGDFVPLTFTFGTAGSVTVNAPVLGRGQSPGP